MDIVTSMPGSIMSAQSSGSTTKDELGCWCCCCWEVPILVLILLDGPDVVVVIVVVIVDDESPATSILIGRVTKRSYCFVATCWLTGYTLVQALWIILCIPYR